VVAVLLAIMLLVLLSGSVNVRDVLSAFSVRFLSLFIEAAPFLLLGTLVSGLIDAFVRQDHIVRFVPRNRFLGVLMGTFAGFIFPVCECGVVPVVRQLYSKKLPMAVGVAFLLGAPVMNPIVLFSTWAAFGWGPILIGRYVITAIVAIAVGLFFAFGRQKLELRAAAAQTDVAEGPGSHLATLPQEVRSEPVTAKLRQAMVVAGDEFFEMGRFLVIGALLASAMQTLVSQDVLLGLGQGPVISVLVMQSLAFLLSVCSTVDAFLALAFAGAFTTGSLLAFLTFGPMVDIKSTIMYLGVFKPKTVAFLVGLPLLLTMLVGIGLNLLGG
jgi:uncharacterized membrane protein YraQ (UPF0718 family)